MGERLLHRSRILVEQLAANFVHRLKTTCRPARPDEQIVQEALAQITWYHNITIIEKVKDYQQRLWYVQQTVANGWSRNVLVHADSRALEQELRDIAEDE